MEAQIGKYHNLVWPGTSPAYISPQQKTFRWLDWPMGDPYNANDYATVAGEPKDQSKAEVVAAVVNLTNIYSGGEVRFDWYRDRDKKLLFTFKHTVPSPSSKGYDYWSWYSVFSWIGKFPHEINEPGGYIVQITSSWGNQAIDFVVEGISITKIVAEISSDPAYPKGEGWVKVNITGIGSGMYAVTDNDAEILRESYNAGTGSTWTKYFKMLPGTHKVCAGEI